MLFIVTSCCRSLFNEYVLLFIVNIAFRIFAYLFRNDLFTCVIPSENCIIDHRWQMDFIKMFLTCGKSVICGIWFIFFPCETQFMLNWHWNHWWYNSISVFVCVHIKVVYLMTEVTWTLSVSTKWCINLLNLHYIDNHHMLLEKLAKEVGLLASTCHFWSKYT